MGLKLKYQQALSSQFQLNAHKKCPANNSISNMTSPAFLKFDQISGVSHRSQATMSQADTLLVRKKCKT